MTTGLFALLAWPAVALAAGVAAVALPVLVHLLTQQRAQVVEWAAMRFLLAAPRHRRRRLDRWLLLALRALTLVAVLAGLCAATPWAESAWQSLAPGPNEVVLEAPRTHRVLILDATLSMSARAAGGGDESRFRGALDAAREAVNSANAGDGFTLIVSGVGTTSPVPGPATDSEKVLAALDEVKPTHGANTLAPALQLAAEALARSPRAFTRKQVVILTDLQRSAWAGLAPGADGAAPDLWSRLIPLAEVAVVDCARADAENVAVADVSLVEPLAWADAPSAVTASVQNFGRSELKQVRVELAVARPGAPAVAVEQRTIDTLPAGGRATVSFALEGAARFRQSGLHLVTVRLAQPDSLPEDDARALVVDVRESLPVLLVNGKPASEKLRRASGYFEEALTPGGVGGAANPVRARSLSLAEFADPALGDLSGVECVVLCDVPSLSPAQLARLDAHLKRGGGVVVGLGPNAALNRDLANRLLYKGGDGLLPGPLGGVAEAPGGYRLFGDDAAFRRPPLSAFRDDNARAGLSLVPVARYLRLDLPAGGAARRLLSYAPADAPRPAAPSAPGPEGRAEPPDAPDAAVVEFPRHRGKVVVVTTSLNADWTDWPVLPTYLPFAQELVRAVASPADRRTLKVGDAIEEFVPVALVGQSATLTRPGGEREAVAVVAGDEAGVLRATDTPISGFTDSAGPARPTRSSRPTSPKSPAARGASPTWRAWAS